jgi:transcriptional regulator with XRE-family HTH domain
MVKKTIDPIDKHAGERLRKRRHERGISQTKLATAIGLTFQQVQKYEKGMNRMGSSRLQQVANVLKVPVTYFFEDAPGQHKLSGKAPSVIYVSKFLATHDGQALIRAFTKIGSAKVRRSIVMLIDNIAGTEEA